MKKCKIEGCENKSRSNKMCIKHNAQVGRYGFVKTRTQADPNEFVDKGDHYEIILLNIKGVETCRSLIDKEDRKLVEKIKWTFNGGYVISGIRKTRKALILHRVVFGEKEGFEIDHINRDPLDNRKKNLRFATKSQNGMNKESLGYRWREDRKKWSTYVAVEGKVVLNKMFKTQEEAKKAVREARLKFHGEFACLL